VKQRLIFVWIVLFLNVAGSATGQLLSDRR